MCKAKKILAEIAGDVTNIDRKLGDMGHYFILYTHTFEQKDEEVKSDSLDEG